MNMYICLFFPSQIQQTGFVMRSWTLRGQKKEIVAPVLMAKAGSSATSRKWQIPDSLFWFSCTGVSLEWWPYFKIFHQFHWKDSKDSNIKKSEEKWAHAILPVWSSQDNKQLDSVQRDNKKGSTEPDPSRHPENSKSLKIRGIHTPPKNPPWLWLRR